MLVNHALLSSWKKGYKLFSFYFLLSRFGTTSAYYHFWKLTKKWVVLECKRCFISQCNCLHIIPVFLATPRSYMSNYIIFNFLFAISICINLFGTKFNEISILISFVTLQKRNECFYLVIDECMKSSMAVSCVSHVS